MRKIGQQPWSSTSSGYQSLNDDNGHGTNVAGIVLGVAPGARVVALDVFRQAPEGLVAFDSDILAAIDWAIANQATYNIVALNLSLGGGLSSTICADSAYTTPFAHARAAVFRAPLGNTRFSLHYTGQTGLSKTELAALYQRFYGSEMGAAHLPANWSSTGNSLEGLAFEARDALLVVDDFAPGGAIADVQRYHKEADRLFRAQGNRSGRIRMRADGTLRPAKPPRGLILSTGEDVPRGHSIRARMLVVEVGPEDIAWSVLSQCQQDAADGV